MAAAEESTLTGAMPEEKPEVGEFGSHHAWGSAIAAPVSGRALNLAADFPSGATNHL